MRGGGGGECGGITEITCSQSESVVLFRGNGVICEKRGGGSSCITVLSVRE